MATHIPTRLYAEMPVTMAKTSATAAVSSDWKTQLPVLQAKGVTLRELRVSDASSLLALLTTEEVTRFISPPPTTIDGFERFITWAQREREAGRYVCFAVVPTGYDTAVGLFRFGSWIRRSAPPNGALRSVRHSGVPACSCPVRSS